MYFETKNRILHSFTSYKLKLSLCHFLRVLLLSASRYVSGNKGKLRFNLRNFTTKADVKAAVDTLEYLGENTNTTGGLQVARLHVFAPSENRRPYIDRIVVLITDGVPTYDVDKLDHEVAEHKREGIRILGLGVTNKVILD